MCSARPSSIKVETSRSTHSELGVSVEQTTRRHLVDRRALSMVSVRIRLTGSSSVSRKAL